MHKLGDEEEGFVPGKGKVPVDQKFLDLVVDNYNFDSKQAKKSIEDNKHNKITACYYLIERKSNKDRLAKVSKIPNVD